MTKYITSKIDNMEYCVINGQFSKHLKQNNISFQEYWETYELTYIPICPHCCGRLRFIQGSRSYASTCGKKECKNKEISATKRNWTDEEKKSDRDNKCAASRNKSAGDIERSNKKRKATNLVKYGVEYTSQADCMKNASKRTKLARYGDENYNNSAVSAKKNRAKTSVEQDVINDKRRKTNVERFGIENVLLLERSMHNSRKSNATGKDYYFPSGRVVGIRGYEHIALNELIQNYNESDIYVDNIKSSSDKMIFEYTNVNQHKAKYYPDIFIKSTNTIIEVKSWWWFNGNNKDTYKSRFENNMKKMKAVQKAGHNFEFWIYDKSGVKTIL